MISAEDIEAFQARWGDADAAADEYARRKKKGLPEDRWVDGTNGAHLVAFGIDAKNVKISLLTQALSELLEAQAAISKASMDASADPMRND